MKSLHHIYIIIITLIERGLGELVFIYCAGKNLVLLECCHQVVPACSGYFHLEHSRSFYLVYHQPISNWFDSFATLQQR
jgi:hypothetical protein